MIREHKAWEAEQARLAEEREIERQRQIEYERERQRQIERAGQYQKERGRQAKVEQVRQAKFVQDTMKMVEKFEREHPGLEFKEKFMVEGRALVRDPSY